MNIIAQEIKYRLSILKFEKNGVSAAAKGNYKGKQNVCLSPETPL